jgi:maltose O-acetyltransferase
MVLLKKIKIYFFQEIPLWLIGLLTAWMPENIFTCKFRGVLFRPFLKKCGRNFQCGVRVRILHPECLEIGDNVYIAQDGWINAKGGITLHDSVTIGPRCGLVTTFHTKKPGVGYCHGVGAGDSSPIVIGSGTWLAMNVIVTAGKKIGAASVVGANAVVTKDIPNDCFAAGVPAKIVK